MKAKLRALALSAALAILPGPALADFLFVPASGPNLTSVGFDSSHSGTSRCAASNTVCFGFVPMDTTGTAFGTSGNPFSVTFPTAQAVTVSGVASATNQTSQITQETAINTVLGTTGSGASCTGSATAIQCLLQMHLDLTGRLTGPFQSTFTDKSGSVSTGGTSQQLAATNANRNRIVIENPCSATAQGISTAEDLYINFTSAASATLGSIDLAPCGSYDSDGGPVTTEQINVVAATTSHKWVAKEM